MWNDRLQYRLADVAAFDPTGGILTAGLMMAGGAMAGAGTLAGGAAAAQGGRMAQAAANFQADQVRMNAGQAIASSQRTMLDTQLKTNLAISGSRATAAASGVNVGEGSAVENQGELAKRGSYLALMDLFNGRSAATGLENEAAGIRYTGAIENLEGQEKETASYLAAGGTLAGSAGSALSSYAKARYPTPSGTAGVQL